MSNQTKKRDDAAKAVRGTKVYLTNAGTYASVPRVKGKPKEGLAEMHKKKRGESENGS